MALYACGQPYRKRTRPSVGTPGRTRPRHPCGTSRHASGTGVRIKRQRDGHAPSSRSENAPHGCRLRQAAETVRAYARLRRVFAILQACGCHARSEMRCASVDPGYPVLAERIEAVRRGIPRGSVKARERIGCFAYSISGTARHVHVLGGAGEYPLRFWRGHGGGSAPALVAGTIAQPARTGSR